MMVIFTSRSEKKAIYTVRRILDSFADRIGNDTWKTVITQEGLLTVQGAFATDCYQKYSSGVSLDPVTEP